ncbi:hypothetical protein N7532_009295 [Penicillium argentinense]|uniref:Cytidyltransferase-like domain-containing protein n=1 Tax=Penicillium argentinense TaxID=1131581 RepID=A0A9W9EZ78_9EURO|nr:uncharacterized protein N7532_009295 [Penicillium argentinense]KAJ5090611.1 hypothetical protein N7532_009295 [Penicillium argentinense]
MSSDQFKSSAALLLLPPPPAFSFERVKEAFEPTVSDVLTKLSESVRGTNKIASIDIALTIPDLQSPSCRPIGKVFAQLQQYLTSIYTLIGAIAAARDIELDSPGGIDTRVLFLDPSTSAQAVDSQTCVGDLGFGPVVGLHSLATSGRQWDHLWYPNNEAGRTLTDSFVQSTEGHRKGYAESIKQAVASNPGWAVPRPLLVPEQAPSVPHYSVIVGGTFDHLHLGHKLLLTALALTLEPPNSEDKDQPRLLAVGVTGDALLVNKKYAEFLESWEDRFQNTAAFLRAIMDISGNTTPRLDRTTAPGPNGNFVVMTVQPNLAFKLTEIWDPYGPTITEENISAIVVSKETSSGGKAVNDERAKKGWKGLAIFEVDVLQAGEATDVTNSNFDGKISSTDIRRRRMNLAKV